MLNRQLPPVIKGIARIDIQAPVQQTMPNGTPLNIIRAGEQEVVRLDILIKSGQWMQQQPLQAMFTNRMLREGSRLFSSAQIAEKLDYYGAWLELSTTVNYSYLTLYSLNKYFTQTLSVIESIVKEPVFPEKELKVIANANKQQFLVSNEKVEVMARKAFNRSLFGEEHPCSRYAEAENYDRLNPEILKSFYRQYYGSTNCSVYVSGCVTADILARIYETFGNEPWGAGQEQTFPLVFPVHSITRKRIFVERADAMQSSIKIGGFNVNRNHPDYHKMKVLATLLGGYFGSRLMSNIREDKGYTYGIGAGLVAYPDKGVFMIGTEAANEYVENIITEVYKEIDILQNEWVSEQELSMVKNYMLGEMCRNCEGPFSLSDLWIFIETGGLDASFHQQALREIQETTVRDIRELACEHLCKDTLIEVVAGKKM